ncbi:unnamed protein product [Discula destructiva]
MSRASFNIRKLIKTWPEDDDENDAFECSSARTIRMQYELEQFQTQQIQKARHEHKHRSWMSSVSAPKTKAKAHRKVPKPIAVEGLSSDLEASRRISTPMFQSPLSGRISPATPISLRSSEESLSSLHGADFPRPQQSHRIVPQRQTQVAGAPALNLLQPLLSNWLSPNGPSSAPLSKGSSSGHEDTATFPSPVSRTRGQSMSSVRHPSPTPSNARLYENPQTPTIIMTPANVATNRSNRSSYVMDGRLQQPSPFVNGQPSPPLEPDEFLEGVIDRRGEVLREMPSVSTLSLNGERTWFNADGGNLSDVSDNVQRLIWETDEAFKAVSSALAEARLSSHSPALSIEDRTSPLQHLQHASSVVHEGSVTGKTGSTQNTQIEAVSSTSPTTGTGRDTIAPRRRASEPPTFLTAVSSNHSKLPASESFVAKPKKASKSSKAKVMQSMAHESSPFKPPRGARARASGGHRPQHSYHRSISRLNLAADKVTDKIFFGFLKIEADEVVTPDHVEQFRQNRLAKQWANAVAKRETFFETLCSVSDVIGDESSSDADVEPFNLQDLPSRIGYSGVNVLSPVLEVATPEPFELNKGVLGGLPDLAGPASLTTTTKEVKVGQDPLATPPPTPPQQPVDTNTVQTSVSRVGIPEDDDSMQAQNLGVPKLASRRLAHKRSGSSTSHIASLPTIPEVKITAPQAWDASRLTQQQRHRNSDQNGGWSTMPTDANGNPYFEEDEEHMFFLSNPVTANVPTFQHGRICLAKADLVNAGTINSLESKLLTSPDETLDWTAFQMAILGGAGDLFNDPDNFLSRDAQEELIDDLCDWAEDLGFSNTDLGTLVRTDKPRGPAVQRQPQTPQTAATSTPGAANRLFHDPSQYKKHAATSSSSSLGSGLTRSSDSPDHSIPIVVESEHPSGFWNPTAQPSRGGDGASPSSRFHAGPGLKRWTLEGHPKRYHGAGFDVHVANGPQLSSAGKALPRLPGSAAGGGDGNGVGRASIDSLPQSPMLELRMMTGVDGSKEFVSMGYNLNHDLGDFLKWESEHVYASGFYGSE